MANAVHRQIVDTVPSRKASPVVGTLEKVIARGAARVTGINETTRAAINDLIQQGIDEGMGPAELGDLVEGWSGFDEYRSELIARTELMDAYNASALGTYDELGVETVQAVDGDGDPECAERDGQEFTLEEADGIEDHPNGTLDWIPLKAAPVDPIHELAMSIGALAAREQPAPVVNYYPAPITVTPAAVNVTVPQKAITRKRVKRDADGNIIEITEEG